MKQAQIISLGIAAVCGLGAVWGMSSIMSRPAKVDIQEVKINTTQVLVAKQEISLGQIVSQDNFRWQDWPQDATNPSFIQKSKKPDAPMHYRGWVARSPVLMNEPITETKIIKPGEGGVLAAILPPGLRAISTRIKEETGVGRLILPNDHVDVILIQRKRSKSGQDEFVADTLFRNVRVLAIGQLIEAKDNKKAADGATATLELTPRQSELLALANSMGEISLALRSVADTSVASGPGTGSALGGPNKSNSIKVLRYGVKSRVYGVN
jgi:pilus assembly protein CpaB